MWNFVITAASNLNILQKPWHFYSFGNASRSFVPIQSTATTTYKLF